MVASLQFNAAPRCRSVAPRLFRIDFLKYSLCHSGKEPCCNDGQAKAEQPWPVAWCRWFVGASSHLHTELSERSNKRIKEDARCPTQRRPKKATAQRDTGQSVAVVEKAGRSQRVELRKHNQLPTVSANGCIERSESLVLVQEPLNSASPQ